MLLSLLLLARLINRQDVVFDELRKFGRFVSRQCRQVIRSRRGNFHSDYDNSSRFMAIAMPFDGKYEEGMKLGNLWISQNNVVKLSSSLRIAKINFEKRSLGNYIFPSKYIGCQYFA